MKLAVQVDGMADALRAIERHSDKLASKEIADYCMEAARELRDLLRSAAPVESGLLRRSIKAFKARPATKGAIVWHQYATGDTKGANYAHIVSFGSRRGQTPNPYFANTIAAHGDRVLGGVAAKIAAYLSKTGYR